MPLIEQVGGRKFFLALTAIIVLAFLPDLSGELKAAAITGLVSAYLGLNAVGKKIADARASKTDAAAPVTVDA